MPPVNPSLMNGFDINQANITEPPLAQRNDGYLVNEIPLADNHAYMFHQTFSWLNYLKSVGISQWDVAVSYFQHSRTMRNGVIYRSNIDANVGNDPLTDTVNWKAQPSDAHLADFANPHQVTAAQVGTLSTTEINIRRETLPFVMTDAAIDILSLAQNEYGRYVLTGTLTADRVLQIDISIERDLIVLNSTTGGFNVTVKGATGTGIVLDNGHWSKLYCDGVNVIDNGTPLGVNQKWTDFAIGGTYVLGTHHINGDRTIALSVTGIPVTSAASGLNITVDGIVVGGGASGVVSIYNNAHAYAIIPPYADYVVNTNSGTTTLQTWRELTI